MILATAKSLNKQTTFVYVLACEGDTYYVGFSRYLRHRLQQHFDGFGAWFTRENHPLGVIELRPAKDERDEFEVWKEYAKKFRRWKVGGFSPKICKALGLKWPTDSAIAKYRSMTFAECGYLPSEKRMTKYLAMTDKIKLR